MKNNNEQLRRKVMQVFTDNDVLELHNNGCIYKDMWSWSDVIGDMEDLIESEVQKERERILEELKTGMIS